MDAITAIMEPFDHAWSHQWESLTVVLNGVTDDEANWQSPIYAAEETESGWPKPGTVRWHVAHVAHCKRYYTQMLRARGETDRPADGDRTPTDTYEQDRAELAAAHKEQRAAIAELTDKDLVMRTPNDMTVTEFLAMCTRHDIWHGGQLAVARRLWRHHTA